MADDAFHELQLNGKQLVFLFMAATVVATVIFLSGVMVGRGVRDARGELVSTADINTDPTDPTTAVPPVPAPVGGSSGTSAATRESLTYPERLNADAPPPEALKEPEAGATGAVSARASGNPPEETPAAPVVAPTAPEAPGFTVQVAAIKERGEADRIAKRLVAKGFPAYVTTPTNEAARFFRVRVGKFQDRREADAMARRLETEEQFKPWVTR